MEEGAYWFERQKGGDDRLPQHLAKPSELLIKSISRYYRDNEYLEALMISGMNIHSFITGSHVCC
jgi:hypothetical protein